MLSVAAGRPPRAGRQRCRRSVNGRPSDDSRPAAGRGAGQPRHRRRQLTAAGDGLVTAGDGLSGGTASARAFVNISVAQEAVSCPRCASSTRRSGGVGRTGLHRRRRRVTSGGRWRDARADVELLQHLLRRHRTDPRVGGADAVGLLVGSVLLFWRARCLVYGQHWLKR